MRQSLPPHWKRAQICSLLLLSDRLGGEGWFSTSVSSIRLLFIATGQEIHRSVHQPLTPEGVSLQAGLEVPHTSSCGALKTRIAIKPSWTCCVRAGVWTEHVFTLGIAKKRGKRKKRKKKKVSEGKELNETWPHQEYFNSCAQCRCEYVCEYALAALTHCATKSSLIAHLSLLHKSPPGCPLCRRSHVWVIPAMDGALKAHHLRGMTPALSLPHPRAPGQGWSLSTLSPWLPSTCMSFGVLPVTVTLQCDLPRNSHLLPCFPTACGYRILQECLL